MKKALALLLVAMMTLSLVAMAIPAAAKETVFDVKRGTPVIDGKLDEAYLDSFYDWVDEEHGEYGFWGGGYLTKEDSPTGEFWALWDDNYLYVFAKVFDKNLCHSANPDGPAWCDDAIEFYIFESAWGEYSSGGRFCVEVDAYGANAYYNGGNKKYALEDIKYACTHEFVEDENWSGEDYNPGIYTIELALPLENLADGAQVTYNFQIDSIWTEDTWDSDRYCSKTQDPSTLTLIAAEAKVAEPETQAPVVDPGTDDPTPTVNPGTADYALVASAVVVMAAAAAVVLKKRK